MKRILIILGHYLPGYKDGGPVRTIKNLTDALGREYEFCVLTCDRDNGDAGPYPGIEVNAYNQTGNAEIYYVRPGAFSKALITELASSADIVYVCGCFNDYARNTLQLKKNGKIKAPVIIAAMGLFSPREFHIKYPKKKAFVTLYNLCGLFDDISWSCSSRQEWENVKREVRTHDNYYIAQDLPRHVSDKPIQKIKQAGELRVFFLGRVSQVKNLIGAIAALQIAGKDSKAQIDFTIYGPKQDETYWTECESELKHLPASVTWQYGGVLDSEKVVDEIDGQHVLLLPSKGENYGHAIQEALSAGCPCIISDQTNWHTIENEHAGYECGADDHIRMAQHLNEYAEMDGEEFQKVSDAAHDYAVRVSNDPQIADCYRKMFDAQE